MKLLIAALLVLAACGGTKAPTPPDQHSTSLTQFVIDSKCSPFQHGVRIYTSRDSQYTDGPGGIAVIGDSTCP